MALRLNGRTTQATLPVRYSLPWREAFTDAAKARIRPGMTILDIGAGRMPSVPVGERVTGIEYWGLDISEKELNLAPPGSYDRTFVRDTTEFDERLAECVDVILSLQVFEHVKSLPKTFEN